MKIPNLISQDIANPQQNFIAKSGSASGYLFRDVAFCICFPLVHSNARDGTGLRSICERRAGSEASFPPEPRFS